MKRVVLSASDGMLYTDGATYGKVVYLSEGETADGWYEISEDEFITAVENGAFNGTEHGVSEQDYQNALKEFGVVL